MHCLSTPSIEIGSQYHDNMTTTCQHLFRVVCYVMRDMVEVLFQEVIMCDPGRRLSDGSRLAPHTKLSLSSAVLLSFSGMCFVFKEKSGRT